MINTLQNTWKQAKIEPKPFHQMVWKVFKTFIICVWEIYAESA